VKIESPSPALSEPTPVTTVPLEEIEVTVVETVVTEATVVRAGLPVVGDEYTWDVFPLVSTSQKQAMTTSTDPDLVRDFRCSEEGCRRRE
jgi:hypothetical protein